MSRSKKDGRHGGGHRCRNCVDCPWCLGNKQHATDRRRLSAEEALAELVAIGEEYHMYEHAPIEQRQIGTPCQ